MLFDEEMMLLAIAEAKAAASMGEVPVGAVITDAHGTVIASAHNTSETETSPIGHAEINAIMKAVGARKSRRLTDCTIYVTLEPCPMCAGAIMNARLRRLVYGAFDENGGAVASVTRLYEKKFGYHPLVRSRVLEKQCSELLTGFFSELRGEGVPD